MKHPISQEGERDLLDSIVSYKGGIVLHLFTNKVTPDAANTVKKFKELSGNGYSPVLLKATAWSYEDGVMEYPPITFLFTGPAGEIYGAYYTRANTGKLLWAETLDDAPFVVRRADYELKITPTIFFRSKKG